MVARRSAAYRGRLSTSVFFCRADDVGVAAGLKYSELAKLRQAMNQVHHAS